MPNSPRTTSAARFGTFAGVFTPNVLTILGIILFLRCGWVVGQAGLLGALAIVGLANVVALLTGLSIAAIATSMHVRAGGNYFMISRTLGLEIGGAIGIPLYLSQAISVAFYVIGFTEAFVAVVPGFDPRVVATVVAVAFGVLAYVGADVALRIQFVVLGVLALALLSFFTGGGGAVAPVKRPEYGEGHSFWTVFAVFFPAVTGIEAGTSLSGDLKDPQTSIPRGTISAVLATAVIYVGTVNWMATHATRDALLTEPLAMQQIARWPALILAGVFAATLSSALGSILAAPRTMQALAADRVLPGWCGHQLGSPTEPRMAVLLTTAIAVAVIWAGDLNFVAPIITMFFLNTYGMTNFIAGLERLIGNPSFRPRFRLPWWVSMLGAAGCYGAMGLINAPVTVAAVCISYGFYLLLQRRAVQRTWGDVRRGLWLSMALKALALYEALPATGRNWRPNILVFSGQPNRREALARMASWLTTGRGLVSFSQLLLGDLHTMAVNGLRQRAEQGIRDYLRQGGIEGFPMVSVAPDLRTGTLLAAQAHGVGGLSINTVLMGWSGTPDGCLAQLRLVADLHQLGMSSLILRTGDEPLPTADWIDIWWGGQGRNAELMLLLGHLVGLHPDWQRGRLRLRRVIGAESGREAAVAHMRAICDSVRVRADVDVLVRGREPIADLIAAHTAPDHLTLMGLALPAPELLEAQAARMTDLTDRLGTVLLVCSGFEDSLLVAV